MKKILALLISILMMFTFVACNNTQDPAHSGSGGGGGPGGRGVDPSSIVNDPDYDPRDPEQYIYRNIFANSPYKDQWDTSRLGADISGVWDSSVLPDVFPAKPDSVTAIDRTEFVGLLDEKISNNPPGELYVEVDYDTEEKPWTYFMVMFEGTEETLNTLVADLAENFECKDEREDNWGDDRIMGELHAYSTDWYIWFVYSQDLDWSSEERVVTENFSFTLYAIPVHHQLPKQVEGLTLPTFGYLTNGVFELIGYSDGDDDYTYTEYNFETGTALSALKENWSLSNVEYYGATMANAESYGQYLIGQGYELSYDSRLYDANSYSLEYEKNDMTVRVTYDADEKCVELWVIKGDAELFYY